MRVQERRTEFKKGIDASEGRRRRTETSIKLRKDKKDEGLAKRRAMLAAPTLPAMDAMAEATPASSDSTSKKIYTVADIPSLKEKLSQPNVDEETLLEVARGFRKMLSVEINPPVNDVLNSGVLPAFVQMLALHDKPKVQFEAAWALTNIASTDQTRVVVDAGAVPYFVGLLSSPNAEVREQSAWCLGNIAGDSPTLRDIVLSAGGLQPLIQNIMSPASPSLFSNCVWALSNFCRGKPQPELSSVVDAVPVLAQILKGDNTDAKVDALWALSYISDGDDDRIQAVLNSGVAQTLVEILGESSSNMVTPALRTVGNIVSGNDEQTQAIIDAGLLSQVKTLLSNPKRMVRKETCWVLSNIAAGTHQQITKVLGKEGGMQQIVELAMSAEWEVRKEAIWVVSNVATGGTNKHVMSVVECGAIDAICSVLDVNDSKMLLVALDAIESILKVGEKLGKDYVSFVDECDGLAKIENLQEHESDEVYQKAVAIIESYFGCEDGVEDENLAPAVSGGAFTFGVPKTLDFDSECPANYDQPMTTFNFAS